MSIIRARDIQLETYDYIMFVDAAGDDGILFEERKSSKTYVVACFVINSSQLNIYNDLLDQLKRIVGANVNQEVKSTTVLKHKKRANVLSFIKEMDGDLYAHIAFKEKLVQEGKFDEALVQKKFFSSMCHVHPIKLFSTYYANSRVLCLIDNMKKVEQHLVQSILEVNLPELPSIPADKLDFCFIDSKSEKYRAIQFADFFAGILREFSISYLEKNAHQRCAICDAMPSSKKLCTNPIQLLPLKHDGISAVKELLNAEQKMCIAVIPKSMGPGFNAICCPKHKHCQNNKKQK